MSDNILKNHIQYVKKDIIFIVNIFIFTAKNIEVSNTMR